MKGRQDFSNTDTYLQTMGKDQECVFVCVCVCINCVYLAVQFFHSDKVQRLERMSCRGDEIKADVDPGVVVIKQRAFDLQLLLQIVFKLGVDVVDNGLVTVERKRYCKDLCLLGKNINVCLLIHTLVMNTKGNMDLSLGK